MFIELELVSSETHITLQVAHIASFHKDRTSGGCHVTTSDGRTIKVYETYDTIQLALKELQLTIKRT